MFNTFLDLARNCMISFDQIDGASLLVSEKKALKAVLSQARKERVRTKNIMRAFCPQKKESKEIAPISWPVFDGEDHA